MSDSTDELRARVARLAADRESGASEIVGEVLAVLREALSRGVPLRPLGRELIQAQPSMAPVYSAVAHALNAEHDPVRFERFAQHVARAPRALARYGAELLTAGLPTTATLQVVTISFSASVVHVLETAASMRALQVSCAEGRPALEGRRLASRLTASGTSVAFYTDAALGHAIAGADAVLVGADAVMPRAFLNKSGTRMLAAAAGQQGVPVYVVASRDKFVSEALAARLVIREGAPSEVWDTPPAGVRVRNPYFEAIPLELVTAVVSDMGVLGAGVVADACRATPADAALALLEEP